MSDVEIKVNGDMIKGIVESKIQAAIMTELSKNPTQIIEAMVNTAINHKVDQSGRVSNYSYENKFSWVEAQFNQIVRKVAEESLLKWVEGQKSEIEKIMMKELSKQKTPMVKSFIDSFVAQAKNQYGFKVEVKPYTED